MSPTAELWGIPNPAKRLDGSGNGLQVRRVQAPPPHGNYVNLALSLGIPFAGSVVMQGLESLVDSVGWRVRLVKVGWDLCILAIGSAAGIFVLPGIIREFGPRAVLWLVLSMLMSFLCAILLMHIRKTKVEDISGVQATSALLLGGAAVTLPWYFALFY